MADATKSKSPDHQVSFQLPAWTMGAGLILLLTLVAYIPAMNGAYIWDDDTYVVMNPVIKSLRGLWMLWFSPRSTPQYYPLVFTSFWLEYHAWGLEPLGYHVVNVLLHCANSLLLWGLLRRLDVPGALLAAAIFAVHPVHVESVAWITERKNVLSGFFYLLAMWSYIRFDDVGARSAPEHRRWSAYVLALAMFMCALFSKTVTCSLPAAICLLLWWKRDRLQKRDLLPLIPLFIMGLIMAYVTAWLERYHVSGDDLKLGLTPMDRIVLSGRAAWFYLSKLVWPAPLAFMYDKWPIDARVAGQWLYAAALGASLLILWLLRRRIGKGPLVAGLFFVGTLLPALGFVDVFPMRYSWVADHFQYLASIGPIVLACALLARVFTSSTAGIPRWASVPAVGVCLILAALTWRQGYIYENVETLWRDTISKTPNSWIAYNNLASFLSIEHGAEAAAPYAEKAIKLNPQNPEAYMNLAMIRLDQGRGDDALRLLDEARRCYGSDTPQVRFHRGKVLMGLRRLDEALVEVNATISKMPGYAPAHFYKGRILLRAGRFQEARESFGLTIFVDPDFVEAICFTADSFAAENRLNEAQKYYELALSRAPKYFQAAFNFANMLFNAGRMADAQKLALQAAELQPENPDAHVLLGAICLNSGQMAEAETQFREAIKLNPSHVEAHFNLANALKAIGQSDAAAEQYREVLRLNPNDGETLRLMNELKRSMQNSAIQSAGPLPKLPTSLPNADSKN